MDVRLAAQGDIDGLIRLRFEFFREEPELEFSGEMETVLEEELRLYYTEHLNKDFFAALVFAEGQVTAVSFLVVHKKPANVHFPTGKTGEILNVYTFPEHRRKGFASAALNLLVDKARAENLSYIELSASAAGKPVYEKLGFIVNPVRAFTGMTLKLN